MAKLEQERVEVFVVISPINMPETKPSQSVATFLNKWRGILKGYDPDKLKNQYLQEKYG